MKGIGYTLSVLLMVFFLFQDLPAHGEVHPVEAGIGKCIEGLFLRGIEVEGAPSGDLREDLVGSLSSMCRLAIMEQMGIPGACLLGYALPGLNTGRFLTSAISGLEDTMMHIVDFALGVKGSLSFGSILNGAGRLMYDAPAALTDRVLDFLAVDELLSLDL